MNVSPDVLQKQRDELETMLRRVSTYAPQSVRQEIFDLLESLNPPTPKQALCLFVMGAAFTTAMLMIMC